MNALAERSHAVRLAELQDACRATTEANAAASPEHIAQMVEDYGHIMAILDHVDAADATSWRWREVRGISSEIAIEMRETLKRAGVVL